MLSQNGQVVQTASAISWHFSNHSTSFILDRIQGDPNEKFKYSTRVYIYIRVYTLCADGQSWSTVSYFTRALFRMRIYLLFFSFFRFLLICPHTFPCACVCARSAISLSYFLIPISPAFLIPRMRSPHPSRLPSSFFRVTRIAILFFLPPPLTLFLSQHLIFITASYPNSLVFLV